MLGGGYALTCLLGDPLWCERHLPGSAYAWLTTIVVQGLLGGLVLALAVGLLVHAWGRIRARRPWAFGVPFAAALAVFALLRDLAQAQNRLAPLGECHPLHESWRMAWLNGIAVSTFVATFALWVEVSRPWRAKENGLLDLVARHQFVRTLTLFMGAQATLIVVATQQLAVTIRALEPDCAHPMVADPELALWYGVPYAALVAVIYAPCAIRLQQLGMRLREGVLEESPRDVNGLKTWAEGSEALQKLAPFEQGISATLRELIPIAAPIAASMLGSLVD